MIFRRERSIFWSFFAVYALLGLAFVFLSQFWADENWYFGASWLVANGELPYRDFFIHHNPVPFYIFALPQYLFGPSIIVGRLTSFLIMLPGFVLVWRLARKLGGGAAALISGGLLISNLFIVYYFTTFSYRALEAVIMLLFFSILLGGRKDSFKYPLAALMLSLVIGIRYPIDYISGLLVLYLAYVAWRCWKNKSVILLSLSASVLGVGIILLPFIILAGDQYFFGTVAFNFLSPGYWVDFGIVAPVDIIFRLFREGLVLFEAVRNFYLVAAIFFGLLFYFIFKVRETKIDMKHLIRENQVIFLMLAFIILFEVFGIIAPQSTVSMSTLTFPAAVIVAGVGLSRVLASVKDKNAALLLYGLIIGLIILTPFAQYAHGNEARPTLTWQKTEMNYILSVADKVAGYTEEGDRILTFTPAFVIQAERELMPGTVMELYAFFPTWETERVRKYNLLNSTVLLNYLSSREPEAVVLTEGRFFSGKIMGRVLDAYRPEIMAALEENYLLVEKLSYPSEIGRGDVYIYLPRTD